MFICTNFFAFSCSMFSLLQVNVSFLYTQKSLCSQFFDGDRGTNKLQYSYEGPRLGVICVKGGILFSDDSVANIGSEKGYLAGFTSSCQLPDKKYSCGIHMLKVHSQCAHAQYAVFLMLGSARVRSKHTKHGCILPVKISNTSIARSYTLPKIWGNLHQRRGRNIIAIFTKNIYKTQKSKHHSINKCNDTCVLLICLQLKRIRIIAVFLFSAQSVFLGNVFFFLSVHLNFMIQCKSLHINAIHITKLENGDCLDFQHF